jgi:exodeoxyribonuclease V alpha subunit
MSDNTLSIEGTVLSVKFFNSESSWGIFLVKLRDGKKEVIKGTLSRPEEGMFIQATGEWKEDKYGKHIKADHILPAAPRGKDSTIRFLCELPHVGPATADKIYAKLGDDSITLILEDPTVLRDIPRMRSGDIEDIIQALQAHGESLAVEKELVELGFGPGLRARINHHFSEMVPEVLSKSPYRLVEVPGIAFPSLDSKLLASGKLLPTHPSRIEAGLEYALMDTCDSQGHTCMKLNKLFKAMQSLGVKCDSQQFDIALEHKITTQHIARLPDDRVSPAELYNAEQCVAGHFKKLLSAKVAVGGLSLPETLNDLQRQAVHNALEHRLSILTGGPGTGKTFTLTSILNCLHSETVILCAPTGKAAKRMSEVTGSTAYTMHYLLAMLHREELPEDTTIILDESSMIGVKLMAEFLNAVNTMTRPLGRLILVGDDDQLPSINPGCILRDALLSGVVPTIKLTQLMRQAADSLIAQNAASIRDGNRITYPEPGVVSDFPFTKESKGLGYVLRNLIKRLPQLTKADGTNYDILKDVQVLSPVYRGEWGCLNINSELQRLLNPPAPSKEEHKRNRNDDWTFREGDKIIITKNNREAGVVNGDIGVLTRITKSGGVTFSISLEDHDITLTGDALFSIQLAYCITVHKAQGSEAPMVIAIFVKGTPPMMRQRNMLYTAITRAREMLWLVADKYTVKQCIENNQPNQRKTQLQELLLSKLAPVTAQETSDIPIDADLNDADEEQPF